MAYETKELTGALFDNEEKQGRQPDFTGNVKIKGKLWRLAGWHSESRNGKKYISLAVSDPADYQRREEPAQQHGTPNEEFEKKRAAMRARGEQARQDMGFDDDDIPF